MWKEVFPEYAVKQSFREQNLERNDEMIVTAMQSDLVTRCLFSLLKPAMIHCMNKKRKYINEKDIEIGKCLSIFPSQDPPENAGHLIDSYEFIKIANEHISLCGNYINENMKIQKENYKISQDTMIKLQNEIEANIRGFVNKLSFYSKNNGNNAVNYKQFEQVMSIIYGDESYTTSHHDYIPFS